MNETCLMAEDKYRLLFENAVETIVIIHDIRVIMCNKMAEILTGYSMGEISVLPIETFIHPEDRPFIMSKHQGRFEGEAVIEQYEFDLLRKDNRVRRAEVNSIKIMWEGRSE